MWVCDACAERNEDSFSTCFNCGLNRVALHDEGNFVPDNGESSDHFYVILQKEDTYYAIDLSSQSAEADIQSLTDDGCAIVCEKFEAKTMVDAVKSWYEENEKAITKSAVSQKGDAMNKTKVCEECRAEIPIGAKKCRNCGSKQGRGVLGTIFLSLVVFVIVAVVIGSGNNKYITPLPTEKTNPYIAKVLGQKMGDVESVLGRGIFEMPATAYGKRAMTVYYTAPNMKHYLVMYAIMEGGNAILMEELTQEQFDASYLEYKKAWGFE